jgi:hypothetical protein
MDVALYSAQGRTFVLVPSCMHPTQEAERLHGPLVLCAHSRLSAIADGALRSRLEGQIDRDAFALLQWHEAQALLGRKHPCFRKRPTKYWPRLQRKRVIARLTE